MNTIKTKWNGINRSIRKAEKQINEGYDVILDFGTEIKPEKLIRVLTYLDDKYGIEISLRHPELQEMIENGIIGGVSGAGVGFIYTMLCGGPVGWATLGFGIIGAVFGVLSTTLHVTIYEYRGHTLVKIER